MNTAQPALALILAAPAEDPMNGSCVEVGPDGTCTVVADPFAREALVGALLFVPGVGILAISTIELAARRR